MVIYSPITILPMTITITLALSSILPYPSSLIPQSHPPYSTIRPSDHPLTFSNHTPNPTTHPPSSYNYSSNIPIGPSSDHNLKRPTNPATTPSVSVPRHRQITSDHIRVP